MKTANRIQLYRLPQGWMARWIGPHADGVRSLFDTDVLPTAYTQHADSETVRKAIADLNPGVDVFIGSTSKVAN